MTGQASKTLDNIKPERENLRQVTTMGTLKQGEKSDTITFKLRLSLLELICIVTVPNDENIIQAPVYVKFRIVGPNE
jgi:hypothetical protein